jgi:hypothetical protein
MKRILLLVTLAIGMVACSNDDAPTTPTPKPCNCLKQTWVKPILSPSTAWYFNGDTEFYSNNCADNGKVIPGNSGQGVEFQYRIKCN